MYTIYNFEFRIASANLYFTFAKEFQNIQVLYNEV